MKRPKLILTGHARHGKDTACGILQEYGYTFKSSSWECGRIAVWPAMQAAWRNYTVQSVGCNNPECCNSGNPPPFPDYPNYEACFADRANHRAFWFDQIKAYNTPDETRLAREILADSDIYCGMRRFEELSACKEHKVCDFVIWIDASKRLPPEPKSSITASMYQAHHVLDNNGSLLDLRIKIGSLYRGFLRPWEARLNQNACLHCGVVRLNFNELANTHWCDSCGKVQP